MWTFLVVPKLVNVGFLGDFWSKYGKTYVIQQESLLEKLRIVAFYGIKSMTSPVPLIVTVWEIMVNIWMRHEMFLISWFSILHIQFSPNPNLSQEIVFSQVCHGIIAVFRGDIHTHWAIPEKIQTSGRGWGYRISRSIEEKNCGNSRGQLKKKWNFQGYSRKTHEISMGLDFWSWNFQRKSVTQFRRISKGKAFFFRDF